jgi:hypothetical protein
MDERRRSDGFAASFVVEISREQAWERLASATPAFEGLGTARDGQWWIPGIEAPADELEVRPEELLRTRKAVEPCRGAEIVITVEDADNGTRITIVQTGFGPGFAERRAWLESGWHAILADLVVFFGRGVSLGRHATWWAGIGCGVVETDEGLVVTNVEPDGFADRAGMRAGDLILQLAGAPVINVRDLSILVRGPLRTGTETTARYLRGEQIMRGAATI